MKRLRIRGSNGVIIADWIIDIKGGDFLATFGSPIYGPITCVSLTELEKDTEPAPDKLEVNDGRN